MSRGEPFVDYMLRRSVGPDAVMLDVGCGPALYRDAVQGRYVGIDITAAPYAAGWARDVDAVATGDALPFADRSFDLVMSKSALYYMPDPRAALAEFHRVLKDGGRVLVVDYNRRELNRLRPTDPDARASWTQRQLRDLVRACGFRQVEILSALTRERRAIEKWIRPFLQELFGSWAIVGGVK